MPHCNDEKSFQTSYTVKNGDQRKLSLHSIYEGLSSHRNDLNFNNSSNHLNLADNDDTITGLLVNPIKSGYLLQFSESEFNAENMIYILEIDRLTINDRVLLNITDGDPLRQNDD